MTTRQTESDALRDQVRARYAAAATKITSGQGGCGCGQPADCGCDSGCCGGAATAEEPGFGAELTEEMLALARRNAAEAGAGNVEWLKGRIEAIPLPAETVDVVISNRVINLSTDKPAVVARPSGCSSREGGLASPTWSPRISCRQRIGPSGAPGSAASPVPFPEPSTWPADRGRLHRHLGELHPSGWRWAAFGHHQGHPAHQRRLRRGWASRGPSRAPGRTAVR
jgi:Methyltransferase domain